MSSRRQERQEARKKDYKKAISADDSRRKREELSTDLRKSKRDEGLMKKRNVERESERDTDNWTPTHIAQQLAQLPSFVTAVMSHDPSGWFQNTVNIRRLLSIGKKKREKKNPPPT